MLKRIHQLIPVLLITVIIAQIVEPPITLERKKLIILASEDENNEITDKIYHIASSAATQLKRYDVIDRNQIERILKEQKFQHSGIVDQDQAVELGKVAVADRALLIQIQNFGQKGVPTDDQEKNEKEGGGEGNNFGSSNAMGENFCGVREEEEGHGAAKLLRNAPPLRG